MAARASSEGNALLETLQSFFSRRNAFTERHQDAEFETVDTETLIMSYFPGRHAQGKPMNNYASMGRELRGLNVLVIVQVHMKTQGKNLLEKAAVALLSDPAMAELDVIVIDSILDEKWYDRLVQGKGGRRRWLPSPMAFQMNVYLTREQVHAEFLGGTRGRKRKNRTVSQQYY